MRFFDLGPLSLEAESLGQPPLLASARVPKAAKAILVDRLAALVERQDWAALFAEIHEVNDALDGGFQVNFFDGQPFLTYYERNQSYFAYRNSQGQWSLAEGSHPIEKLIQQSGRSPEVLRKRFKVPDKMFLVGFESNAQGQIIPIFSTSRKLTFFRDFKFYDQSKGFSAMESASKREATIVPLVRIKTVGFVNESGSHIHELPKQIQDLLNSRETLTTTFSAPHTHEDFVDLTPTNYSALIIASSDGQGRMGAILQDGIPLLVAKDGQEYFLEIKGIGAATFIPPNVPITHSRGPEGEVRTGRIPMAYASSELDGYNLSVQNVSQGGPLQRLYSRSVLAVTLPEHDSKWNMDARRLQTWGEVEIDAESGQLSAQVFRLNTSSRRVAFSDNPAFGRRYSSRESLLKNAQRYYGKILGDLLIRESSASVHESPHSENFVYFPLYKALTHIDYADIARGYNLVGFLGDLLQYGVFSGSEGHAETTDFYAGLRSSLEPRGLWTPRLQKFSKERRTVDEFEHFIFFEFIFPFLIKDRSEEELGMSRLPRLSEVTGIVLARRKQRNMKDKADLEIHFRKMSEEARKVLHNVKGGIMLSTLVPSRLKIKQTDLQPLVLRLKKIVDQTALLYRQGLAKNWSEELDFYIESSKQIYLEQAQIYDSLERLFGFPGNNSDMLKKAEIFSPNSR